MNNEIAFNVVFGDSYIRLQNCKQFMKNISHLHCFCQEVRVFKYHWPE